MGKRGVAETVEEETAVAMAAAWSEADTEEAGMRNEGGGEDGGREGGGGEGGFVGGGGGDGGGGDGGGDGGGFVVATSEPSQSFSLGFGERSNSAAPTRMLVVMIHCLSALKLLPLRS